MKGKRSKFSKIWQDKVKKIWRKVKLDWKKKLSNFWTYKLGTDMDAD